MTNFRLRGSEGQRSILRVTTLALIIRLTLVFVQIRQLPSHSSNFSDFGFESWEMGWTARSISLGRGFSSPFFPFTGYTALVPPLYPYLLAGAFRLCKGNAVAIPIVVLSFNSFCSGITCVPLYLVTRNVLSERLGRLTALAWAIYPFSIYFAAARMWDYALTALLFTCCLLWAMCLFGHRRSGWFGFGCLFGFTVMSNPSTVSILPLLLIAACLRNARVGRPWVNYGLSTMLGFVLVCMPWTIRNHHVMHSDFFVRDGFWLEFYAGNNGDTSTSNSAFAHPGSNPEEMRKYQAEGEISYMAEKRSLAISFVREHPGFFAIATVRRIVRFWTGYWSFSPQYLRDEPLDLPNVPFCSILLIFMVRGLRLWWRRDRIKCLPYLLAVVVFPLPYYVTHSSMDYREPLEPVLIMLIVAGMFWKDGHDDQARVSPSPSSMIEHPALLCEVC